MCLVVPLALQLLPRQRFEVDADRGTGAVHLETGRRKLQRPHCDRTLESWLVVAGVVVVVVVVVVVAIVVVVAVVVVGGHYPRKKPYFR